MDGLEGRGDLTQAFTATLVTPYSLDLEKELRQEAASMAPAFTVTDFFFVSSYSTSLQLIHPDHRSIALETGC